MKFLNSLPLSVLDESLKVFRENIFSIAGRKQIPHLIYQILEKQLIKEEHGMVEEYTPAVKKVLEAQEDAGFLNPLFKFLGFVGEKDKNRISMQEHLVEQQQDQAALFNFSKQIYGAM